MTDASSCTDGVARRVQPAGSAAGANRSTGAARIALFDNIKGVLIILVVAGHFMHPVHNDNPALSCAFDLIYLFHMPLFVFVSGLFAKGAYRDGRLNVNRIISFIVLGVAYQALLLAITGILTPARMLMFTSAPWYLLGMAWWYLATPMLARLKPWRGIALSCTLALAWGCVDIPDGLLGISRSFAFLPYFALGYYCSTSLVERVAGRRELWLCVGAAAVLAVLRIANEHAFDWFFPMVYGDNPYGSDILLGIAGKLVTMVIALVCSLALLRVIPRNASWLTVLGKRTLQVYVLHRLIRAWLTFHTGFYDLSIVLEPAAGLGIICAISAAVVALCALRCFEAPFNKLMRLRWIRV